MDNIYNRWGQPDVKAMLVSLMAAGETLLDWTEDLQEGEVYAVCDHPDKMRSYGIDILSFGLGKYMFHANKDVLQKHLSGWAWERRGESTFDLFSDAVMWCELDGLNAIENRVPDSNLESGQQTELMMTIYQCAPSATRVERARLYKAMDELITRLTGEAYTHGWKEGNAKAMPWIPVSEAMPEPQRFGYEVLVHIPHLNGSQQQRKPVAAATVPRYRNGPWQQIGGYKLEEHDVSHWMPMPQAPPVEYPPDPFLIATGATGSQREEGFGE